MSRVKRKLEDYPQWIREFVVKDIFERRKNQYSNDKTFSVYFRVDVVPFRLMLENGQAKHLKWKVRGYCNICKSQFEASWNNMWLRKIHKGEEVCGKCCRKESYTDEWRENNSKAQKKVQGTEAARARMSKRLKEVHRENPEIAKNISKGLKKTYRDNSELREKIGDASRRNWKKVDYQEKVSPRGFYHGYFNSRCGRIFYASSWELAFLVWCNENNKIVKFGRCCDRIKYQKPNGGMAYYHPDFEVVLDNGKFEVVEVKGSRSSWCIIDRKRIAAEEYYGKKKTYWIAFKEDLERMGCFVSPKKVKGWIQRLADEGIVDSYGKGKSSKKIPV